MEKNNYHILVVDDDDKIRSLIKEYLSNKGYVISTAENAEKAKIKVDVFNFNLIILDVMMPGQSGYELTKELKASKNIPIILLTAKGEVENRIHGLEIGADDYIGKPFDPKELLLRVKNVIKMNINPNAIHSNMYCKSFIGNPETAKVIILYGNPGLELGDYQDEHKDKEYIKILNNDLRFHSDGFLFLNDLSKRTGGYNYWSNEGRLNTVIEGLSLKKGFSKEKAIEYAENNNISYTVIEPKKKEFVIKSYADNFLKN